MLIFAGLAMLGEWALDLRGKTPVRRGGNYVGLLILLAIIGVSASWTHANWNWMHTGFGGDNNDFFNMLGRPQHDLDQQVLNTDVPQGAVIVIENPRGDVSVTAGDTIDGADQRARGGVCQLGQRGAEDLRVRGSARDGERQDGAGEVGRALERPRESHRRLCRSRVRCH